MSNKYPEHEKLDKIKDLSQTCGEFLTWLTNEKGVMLATYSDEEDDGNLYRYYTPINKLLGEFFEIDTEKLEAEKLSMLEEIRTLNAQLEQA